MREARQTDNKNAVLAQIERRHRQLLFHSFLYYRLNESVIADTTWDQWCKELVELRERFPEIAEQAIYSDVCSGFDGSGSGYFLTNSDFPDEIVAVAARFAYGKSGKLIPFEAFLEQHGLRLLEDDKPKAKRSKKK